jgi:hypothetical protein
MAKTCLERTDDLREIVAGLESFNRNVSHDLRNRAPASWAWLDWRTTPLWRRL